MILLSSYTDRRVLGLCDVVRARLLFPFSLLVFFFLFPSSLLFPITVPARVSVLVCVFCFFLLFWCLYSPSSYSGVCTVPVCSSNLAAMESRRPRPRATQAKRKAPSQSARQAKPASQPSPPGQINSEAALLPGGASNANFLEPTAPKSGPNSKQTPFLARPSAREKADGDLLEGRLFGTYTDYNRSQLEPVVCRG